MKKISILVFSLFTTAVIGQTNLYINNKGYFEMEGLNVTLFSDYYPEGHQSGVSIIQHGIRVAANGDIRLETSPGQWSPVPKVGKTIRDEATQTISTSLSYPDPAKNRTGFNPVIYPDLKFSYKVNVQAKGENSFRVSIDFDEALPSEWIGKIGFNLELFPGDLFGKTFLMNGQAGMFPLQASGEMQMTESGPLNKALAIGNDFVIAPEEDKQRIHITSTKNEISLWDGRSNHNNGWYIVRSLVPEGATKNAIVWDITPNVVKHWRYDPVIQVSQLGYHPEQAKRAVFETDPKGMPEGNDLQFTLLRMDAEGGHIIKQEEAKPWGNFLRYKYFVADFSDVKEPGSYIIEFGGARSNPFLISKDVYKNNTWQPTLEYYLPVQMCHMRINEKYRVWHDYCHMDDALMAPVDHNHFDGYKQSDETYTDFAPGEHVPGLNSGGWHDAGDYDLRVESQAKTVWMLALMMEEFNLYHDATLIDPEKKIVEIHVPDGRNDAIQQLEHGLEAILGGYRSLGRLYRGIIAADLRQYVMLGDASSMTDNVSMEGGLESIPGMPDDRWVFTEDNPDRELTVAAGLAAAARVLKEENPELSSKALELALILWSGAHERGKSLSTKILALSELIITTDDPALKDYLYSLKDEIAKEIDRCGWIMGHVKNKIDNPGFASSIKKAVENYQAKLMIQQEKDSPYGVPYTPNIWGAGWNIQRFGVEQYFYHKGWPEIVSSTMYENALNFILGVHPGSNTASFASGVGSKSVTVAYGVNRADWSFIPGGVASGTALIRPDLPEMKTWPFFWQQTEYVMGGGATNFMFLVLATDSMYSK